MSDMAGLLRRWQLHDTDGVLCDQADAGTWELEVLQITIRLFNPRFCVTSIVDPYKKCIHVLQL